MTTTAQEPTIAAIATPRGTGGVAIIRISGSQSWDIARSLVKSSGLWQPGTVLHDWVIDPKDEQTVDEVLILPFKAPNSYTGEDCVEIQCHGGLVLSKTILNLCFQQGAAPATAGEFTRRAYLNGRIDLTQAESVLDLIHAQGETMVKLAAHNLHHRAVGAMLNTYLSEITGVQADLTASIDFPDEVDEPDRPPLAQHLRQLVELLRHHLELSHRNQVVRDGINVVLAGLPNAGKSSLFNALLQSDRSIVTDIAGTTRDMIRESLSLKGIPINLIDTAGLRETADVVEVLGVERSWQAVESAQAVIYLVDGTQGLTEADKEVLTQMATPYGLVVFNKHDAAGYQTPAQKEIAGWSVAEISVQNGHGIPQVLSWLENLAETLPDLSDMDVLLSQRQMVHLGAVLEDITEAAQTLEIPDIPLDLATVPLTNALLELQGLLGQDTTEQVLDTVFERFCVGK